MVTLAGKNVVVAGASGGVGGAIVGSVAAEGAQIQAVGRNPESLDQLAKEVSGTKTLAIEAAGHAAPSRVFAALLPDVVILCAGARPPGRPIHELTWDQFSVNWDTDVRMSFSFCREALRAPLAPGSTVILISSGAALGGSPISCGYVGARRTQLFMADYAHKESGRPDPVLGFLALARPRHSH